MPTPITHLCFAFALLCFHEMDSYQRCPAPPLFQLANNVTMRDVLVLVQCQLFVQLQSYIDICSRSNISNGANRRLRQRRHAERWKCSTVPEHKRMMNIHETDGFSCPNKHCDDKPISVSSDRSTCPWIISSTARQSTSATAEISQ